MSGPGNPRNIGYEKARAELERVLASDAFKRAPNVSKLLRYVCEQYFQGASPALKEYNIAVEAFGRPAEFNPAENSIVRVEAFHLRKRLRQYYETEGADHTVQIRLAETGYIPRFISGPRIQNGKSVPEDTRCASAGKNHARNAGKSRQGVPVPHWRQWPVLLGTGLAAALLIGAFWLPRWNRTGAKSSSQEVFSAAVSKPESRAPSGIPVTAEENDIRISSGSSLEWKDAMGQAWLGDRYFSGGVAIARPDRRIYRTLDQSLYRTAREREFRYDIPLKSGLYELHLHFAEIVFGNSILGDDGTGHRRFNVSLNGKLLLNDFDIVLDAGGSNIADEKVFTDVSPADDGLLHLKFSFFMKAALLAGIEIMPGIPGRMRPVRIVTSARSSYDSRGQLWGADRYFRGGRTISHWTHVAGTKDPGLYSNERWGNFTYAVPVARGSYTVSLLFAESNFGMDNFGTPKYDAGGVGSRIFNVYCNGVALLRNFDIFKEAKGPNRAVRKTFRGLTPNAQGKLVLSFAPVKDYATVRAIEVIAESQ